MKKLNENEPIIITRKYTIDLLEDGTYIQISKYPDVKPIIYKTFQDVLDIHDLYDVYHLDNRKSVEAILKTLERNNVPFQYDSRYKMLNLIDRVYYVDDICTNVIAFYDSILK